MTTIVMSACSPQPIIISPCSAIYGQTPKFGFNITRLITFTSGFSAFFLLAIRQWRLQHNLLPGNHILGPEFGFDMSGLIRITALCPSITSNSSPSAVPSPRHFFLLLLAVRQRRLNLLFYPNISLLGRIPRRWFDGSRPIQIIDLSLDISSFTVLPSLRHAFLPLLAVRQQRVHHNLLSGELLRPGFSSSSSAFLVPRLLRALLLPMRHWRVHHSPLSSYLLLVFRPRPLPFFILVLTLLLLLLLILLLLLRFLASFSHSISTIAMALDDFGLSFLSDFLLLFSLFVFEPAFLKLNQSDVIGGERGLLLLLLLSLLLLLLHYRTRNFWLARVMP
ncbi:hypothetical protein TorRG33x02_131690 [Trema orientale]|uniref:Transmembrane protein n=1 Tax=Trema orientale TaxID=63057 RepID=A0A2P5F025_TREOI|nr:hypothetical protein TorRG33x02_131690 [Trema orientale]